MNCPANLSDQTLPGLKQIVADFPYFHAARMLYLKNLAILEDICLQVELKKMAIHIPDRAKLFTLLEGDQPVKPHQKQPAEEEKPVKKESKFNLVENYLSTPEAEIAEDSLTFDIPAAADYMQLLTKDESEFSTPVPELKHQNLIDSFIKNENEGQGKHLSFDPDEEDHSNAENESPAMERNALDSSYFTETLAYVYIKQKRYDKALDIIKNLSLKYPEKNIYFADQIRFLEKLIIHTKK
jgi:hypothetical protein